MAWWKGHGTHAKVHDTDRHDHMTPYVSRDFAIPVYIKTCSLAHADTPEENKTANTQDTKSIPMALVNFGLGNQLFNDFFDDFLDWNLDRRSDSGNNKTANRSQALRSLWPSIDVYDLDKEVKVHAEVPGVKKEDIDINYDPKSSTLTLSGQSDRKYEHDDGGRKWEERRFGQFSRTITLPSTIDADKVQASLQNGVLDITIPKAPETEKKRITVN